MASLTVFHHGIFILLVLYCHSTEVTSSKVLGIFPMAGKSHTIAFNALMIALAERGHDVTTLTPYPSKKNIPNFKEFEVANFEEVAKENEGGPSMMQMKNLNVMSTVYMLKYFSSMVCEKAYNSDAIQEILKTEETYDVIFLSTFFNECFLGIVHKLKAPLILISSFGSLPWTDDAVGNPYPYSYVPNSLLKFGDHMCFTDRFINAAVSEGLRLFYAYQFLPAAEAIARKYVGNDLPPFMDINRNASMVFLNNHLAFNYPRPHLPTVVEVGGMHCVPAKPLPQDLLSFVDGSGDDGFILFSMGSNLKSKDFPVAQRDAFVRAFSKIKQRVVWKWEDEILPGKTENVYIGKWLPQQDILGHPKIRAFITHGGLLSTQETIYHGVPVIGIPVFGDQDLNMQKAVIAGYGIKLELETITEEVVSDALNKVLNDPSYRENVKKRHSVFLDQPEDSLTRAVFWTEYVIRHRGAHHLRSAALDLSWYQLYLLDVIAVVVLALLLVTVITVTLLRCVFRSICGGKKKAKKE